MPDFVSEDDILILGERDILFSRERWSEIARSIRLKEIPCEMKNEIADILVENLGTDGRPKAIHRKALKRLVETLNRLGTKLYKVQHELNSNQIIDRVKGLREHAESLQIVVEVELSRTMSKGGRPRKTSRARIAHAILDVFAKYTRKPIRLSRDSHNRPSGPCYRFLCTIFQAWGMSTAGLARVIEEKRDMPKTLLKPVTVDCI
jgi:hypothetical protein